MTKPKATVVGADHPQAEAVAQAIADMLAAVRGPVDRLSAATGMARVEALLTITSTVMGHALAAAGWAKMGASERTALVNEISRSIQYAADQAALAKIAIAARTHRSDTSH